jgi:hypothetical protein
MDSIHELKEESRKLINRITWLQQTAAYAAPEYAVKLHGEVDRLLRHIDEIDAKIERIGK